MNIKTNIYKIRKMSDFAFVLLRTKRDVLQCVLVGEHVTGVEEHHVVAVGILQSLVHSVVKTAVRFADHHDVVFRFFLCITFSVGFHELQGIVFGSPVYYHVLYLRPRLGQNALKSALHHLRGVPRASNYAEFYHDFFNLCYF